MSTLLPKISFSPQVERQPTPLIETSITSTPYIRGGQTFCQIWLGENGCGQTNRSAFFEPFELFIFIYLFIWKWDNFHFFT